MTLAEFLLERIGEDEAEAREADQRRPIVTEAHVVGVWLRSRYHMTIDPTRALAECEAKRGVIAAALDNTDPQTMALSMLTLEWVLSHLALPYADHPDYREEWKP